VRVLPIVTQNNGFITVDRALVYTVDFNQHLCIAEQALELIMKPVLPMELLRKVREMLDSK